MGAAVQAVLAEVRVTSRATDLRVDWRRIIADLRTRHGSVSRVAVLSGIPRTTLASLVERFSEPGYSDGRMLLVLWAEATGGEEFAPPMVRLIDQCEP
jgi:hypothetical protein